MSVGRPGRAGKGGRFTAKEGVPAPVPEGDDVIALGGGGRGGGDGEAFPNRACCWLAVSPVEG